MIVTICIALSLVLTSCDRGATEQIQAAQKFADAVTTNNIAARDSMIATRTFLRHFENPYVARDYISWLQTIYDFRNKKFFSTSRADVDRDLREDLRGGLISADSIEETGMVRVKSMSESAPTAYFWMVRQKGHHWAVAIVTKGEVAVDFNR